MRQLSLFECKGFKKKIGPMLEVLELQSKTSVPSLELPGVPLMPERLVGKIRQCEFCGTIEGVEVVECTYVCAACFEKYGTAQECKVIYERGG